MPELSYRQLASYLDSLRQGKSTIAPVYLLHGDELLCKKALNALLDGFIPPEDRSTHYEAFEGLSENLPKAIESLQTFSFFPGIKVIGFLDTTLFAEKVDAAKMFAKWQEACLRRETRNAVAYLRKLLSVRSIEMTASEIDIRDALSDLGMSANDRTRLSETLMDLRRMDQERQPAEGLELLETEIRRGFPEGHHLVLTTDSVDRRKSVYKWIVERGIVVDCSIPKDASTKASRQTVESILIDEMHRMTAEAGKQLSGEARQALLDKTGYDVRKVTSELAKLIQYAGSRREITAEDVAAVISKTKKDPVFEFTNAVMERKLIPALTTMASLLDGDLFPPQIVAALHNQLRKLMLARSFLETTPIDMTRMDFDAFRNQILPKIATFDGALQDRLQRWRQSMEQTGDKGKEGAGKKRSKAASSVASPDLGLMKKGQNPYPIFLLLKRAQTFPMERLTALLDLLVEADERLKSGVLDVRAVLEHVLLAFCMDSMKPLQKGGKK